MTATTTTTAKNVCYGEFYSDDKYTENLGDLYKMKDGSFALVQKQEFSGKWLSVNPIDPKTVCKFHVTNLGYALVHQYTYKASCESWLAKNNKAA